MIKKQERRELIAQFSGKVQEHFYFLESEYGYVRGELKKCDFHYPQDAYVAIPYLGKNVGVQISDVGHWRAIKLESLIDLICPEKTFSHYLSSRQKSVLPKQNAGLIKI